MPIHGWCILQTREAGLVGGYYNPYMGNIHLTPTPLICSTLTAGTRPWVLNLYTAATGLKCTHTRGQNNQQLVSGKLQIAKLRDKRWGGEFPGCEATISYRML